MAQIADTATIQTTVEEISQMAGIDNVAINTQWLDHSLQLIHAIQTSLLIATTIAFFDFGNYCHVI